LKMRKIDDSAAQRFAHHAQPVARLAGEME
jgi:hypothetical protein